MVNVLLVYHSRSGNTKTMAETIANAGRSFLFDRNQFFLAFFLNYLLYDASAALIFVSAA